MDAHLRLNLKPLREHRERLHKLIAKCPVACHDIADITLEHPVDGTAHKRVAKVVKGSLIFLEIRGGQPVPDHHVRAPLKHCLTQLSRLVCRVCVIPVCHNITLRVDLTEHAPYDISLSLLVLIAHDCARPARDLIRPVL